MKNQFRGWWIPAEIVEMMGDELKPVEVIMLAMIDGLVTAARGCYASNGYLAEKMGVTESYASKLITSLKKKGLVIEIAYDGRRRYLETIYSRIERGAINNKWLRKKLDEQRKKAIEEELDESTQCESDIPGGNARVSNGKPCQHAGDNRTRIAEEIAEEEEHLALTAARSPAGSDSSESNGTDNRRKRRRAPDVGFGLSDLSKFDRQQAARVRRAVELHGTDAVAKIETYARCINRLRTRPKNAVSEARIAAAVDFLVKFYSDQYTPKLRRSDALYDTFGRIEEAARRAADAGAWDQSTEQHDRNRRRLLIRAGDALAAARGWDQEFDMTPQDELDGVLASVGLEPGSATINDLHDARGPV